MAQKDAQVENPAAFNLFPAGLADLSNKRTAAAMAAQHDLFNEAQELNQADRSASSTGPRDTTERQKDKIRC